MCKIDKSDFEEYKEFCLNSLEPGIPQFCENYIFDKLVDGDDTICILGYAYDDGKTYLVGSFSQKSCKYVRDLIEWGNVYLDCISEGIMEVIVEDGQRVYQRFAEFFGFEKTLAQGDITGIMYSIYTRVSKCLQQQ